MKMEEFNILYEESTSFKWIWIALVPFVVASFFFAILAFRHGFAESAAKNSLPIWFYLIMVGVFALILAVLLSSRKLKIKMNTKGIQVGLGFFKTYVPYGNIESFSSNEKSALSYGGFGIRTSRIRGRWVTAYNVGGNHVVIDYKDKNRSLVFSSKDPRRIIEIIKEYRVPEG